MGKISELQLTDAAVVSEAELQQIKTWVEIESLSFAADASKTSTATIAKGKSYRISFSDGLLQNTTAGYLYVRFNGDSGNNYGWNTTTNAATFTYPFSAGYGVSGTSNIGLDYEANSSHCKIGSAHFGHFEFAAYTGDGSIIVLNGKSSYLRTDGTFVSVTCGGYYDGASDLSSITIGTSAGTLTGTASIQELKALAIS